MNKFIQKWKYGAMKFHNVFDEILGTKTKVKLLRAFFTYQDKEFSESELQRIAGIPQASVHRNVKSLLENGLLNRKRIGKVNLYSLNKEHITYSSIGRVFDEEKTLIDALKGVIREKIKDLPEIRLAVLFGSIVKARERADSDIDIFIVSPAGAEVEEKLKDLILLTENKFGNPVSLMIKQEKELKELHRKAVFKEIRNGEVIFKREGFEW